MVEPRPLWSLLTCACESSPLPVLLEEHSEGDTVLAGASLHTSALSQWHTWRRQGVRPGDVLEDAVPWGLRAVVRLLACVAGGLAWRPLKENARPFAVLGRASWRWTGAELREVRQGDLEQVILPPGTCLLLETSGSDGTPRLVPLTQAAVRWQLEAHLAVLPLAPDQVRVACLPWVHAFGVVLDLLLGLAARQTVVLAPLQAGWTARGLSELLDRHDASWWCTVPRVLELVVRSGSRRASSSLNVLVGGASVSERLVCETQAFLAGDGGGGAVHVGYGLTEAGPGLAIDGRLLPGVEAEVRGGRLWVRSPAWCARTGPDGWSDTGDLAALDGHGRVEVIGRASRVVKGVDGQWVSLDALEAELCARFEVCAISVSRRDAGWNLTLLTNLPGGAELKWVQAAIARRLGPVVSATGHGLTDEVVTRLTRAPTKNLGQALALLAG